MEKTKAHKHYLRKLRNNKILIRVAQASILLLFFLAWEFFAHIGTLSVFLFSKPTLIYKLFLKYLENQEIFKHIWVSLQETLLGLIIGTAIGILVAIILYWYKNVAKIFEPYLVVLNALPKTALAPILIVWCGAGMKGIVIIAIITSIVVTILSAYNFFLSVSEEKIKMFKTFKASKWQTLTKLILPSNLANLISIIKINIGMSWVGVIVGEFLVSRAGLGYLIVYGGQVFSLDLVMMGVLILAVLAYLMYQIVNSIEKYFRAKL